jgi:hypothetical protein
MLSAACDVKERKRALKRLGFYKCDITIPDPYDCAALEALMKPASPGTPSLVFSNELQDVQFADPTKVTREISDVRPEYEITASRDITFKDRIAVDLDAQGAASPFYDYTWWKNIKNLSTRLNILLLWDDNTITVPRKEGSLEGLPNVFDIYLNQEKVQNGFIVEFKQGLARFLGDPLDFNKPGIKLDTCPALSGLF